jgi:prepilin-type processing-associated H-X9-DG protein
MSDDQTTNAGDSEAAKARLQPSTSVFELVLVIAIIATLIAILLPIVNRLRGRTPRQTHACAVNLSHIGLALAIYQHDHAGAVPESLKELVAAGELNVASLVCPLTSDTPATGATPAETLAELSKGGHISYVYLGGGIEGTVGSEVVLAYERSMNHLGAHVLFADGHVDWLTPQLMQPILDDVAAGRRPLRIRTASSTRPTTAPSP